MVCFRSTASSLQEKLKKYNMTKQLVIRLQDIRQDRNYEFNGNHVTPNTDSRRKKFTCYVCLDKFSSAVMLAKHKSLHTDTDIEDDGGDSSPESNTKKNTNNKPKTVPKSVTPPSEPTDESVPNKTQKTTKVTPFKCDSCNVFFEGSDEIKTHKVLNKCKFSCRICNRKFNTLYAFVVHVMQHKSNAAKNPTSSQMVYTCSTCKEQFDNLLLLRSHEIKIHDPQPETTPPSTETTPPPETTEITPATVKTEPLDLPVSTEPEPNIDTPMEYCCELCYDVFETPEQMKAHMEFHQQLENKPEAVEVEDNIEVEVTERRKGASEIITTIKSKPKVPPTAPEPVVGKVAIPRLPRRILPNQTLTDSIKEMLTPRSEKQSKTILLPPDSVKNKRTRYKKKSKTSVTPPVVDGEAPSSLSTSQAISQKTKKLAEGSSSRLDGTNLELRKTGPFSFALNYVGANNNTDSTQATPSSSSTTSASSSVLTPMVPNYTPLLSTPTINPNIKLVLTSVPYLTAIPNMAITTTATTPTTNQDVSTTSLSDVSTTSNTFVSPLVATNSFAYIIIPHGNTNSDATTATTEASQIVPSTTSTTIVSEVKTPVISSVVSNAEVNTKDAPPKQSDEAIVIDSDSSNGDNGEKKNEDQSESDGLVIDESVPTEGAEKKVAPDQSTKPKLKFPMKCDGCSVVFHKMKRMRNHNLRKQKCKLCTYTCCKMSDLRQHYILEHRKFLCTKCSYLAHSKREFTAHNSLLHVCRTCNGCFVNLLDHKCATRDIKNGNQVKS